MLMWFFIQKNYFFCIFDFKSEETRKNLLQLINNKDNELDKAQINLADAYFKLETAQCTEADVSTYFLYFSLIFQHMLSSFFYNNKLGEFLKQYNNAFKYTRKNK